MRVAISHLTRLDFAAEVMESVMDTHLGPRDDTDQYVERFELHLEPVRCQEVIEEVATTLRPLAQEKGLSFDLDLPPEPSRLLAAPATVGGPGFRRDREAGRHGDTHVGHFRQLAPLAAQKVAQRARAVRLAAGEGVHVLGSTSGRARGLCPCSPA